MDKKVTYEAFISYSHIDSAYSRKLQKMLERIGRPFYIFGKRRITIFRDETDLSQESSLPDSIGSALDKAGYFILMASEIAARSKWVDLEVQWWLKQKSADRILIVTLQGELIWAGEDFDWTKTSCLPSALRGCFTKEPLYLDWRIANKKGFFKRTVKTAPVIRLAARLLDRPPRELARTETRTLSRIMGILLLIVLAFGFLSYQLMSRTQKIIDIGTANNHITDSLKREAFIRSLQLAKDTIKQDMNTGAVYMTAKLDTYALQMYSYAYYVAKKPQFDTVAELDDLRAECSRKIAECQSKINKPHP